MSMRIVTLYVMDADDLPIEDMCEDYLRTKGIECATENEFDEWYDANSEEPEDVLDSGSIE